MEPSVEERVARLPCWHGAPRLEGRLPGLTNAGLRVRDRAGTWVVRLGRDVPWHGIDRRREAQVTRAAAAAGLAPPVLHAGDGVLVLAYVDGRTLEADDLARSPVLGEVLHLVERCHARLAGADAGWPADRGPAAVLDGYLVVLASRHNRWREEAGRLAGLVADTAAALAGRPVSFAHNDLHAGNLVDDGSRLWLIDWEYAGRGDALMDLASLANNGAGAALGQGMAPDDSATQAAFVWMRLAAALRDLVWGYAQDAFGDVALPPDYLPANRERVAQAAARARSRSSLSEA